MNFKDNLIKILSLGLFLFLIPSFYFGNKLFSQNYYWEKIDTPDSSFVRSFVITQDGTLFLGMGGSGVSGGIYRSYDDGQTWEFLIFEDFTAYSLEICDNGDILAGINYSIFKSIDNGDTWYQTFNFNDTYKPIFSAGNGLMFSGGVNTLLGIIRSYDYGETWDTCYLFNSYGLEYLRSMTISNDGTIYAGTANTFGPGHLYMSSDNGDNWEVFSTPDDQFYGLAIHPQGDLFVGDISDGLYRYNFNSQLWSHDLYNISPHDFLFIGNNIIYVGCNENPTFNPGVLYSEDGGQNYEWLNSNAQGYIPSVSKFVLSPSGYIYIKGGFIYKSTEKVITAVHDPVLTDRNGCINSPNPFTTMTEISWEPIKSEPSAHIMIYNSYGRIKVDKWMKNDGSCILNGSNLEPGVYYYTITNSNENSGKMIKIK